MNKRESIIEILKENSVLINNHFVEKGVDEDDFDDVAGLIMNLFKSEER